MALPALLTIPLVHELDVRRHPRGRPRHNHRRRILASLTFLSATLAVGTPAPAQLSRLAGPCRDAKLLDRTTLESTPDSAPRLVSTAPRTPSFARHDGYRGSAQVAVIVDTTGLAEAGSALILAASDAQMRAWACNYVEYLRFTPAMVGERAVRTQVVVPFEFRATVVRRRR